MTPGQCHQSGHDAEGPFSDKRSPVAGPPPPDQDDKRALQDRVYAEESAHRLEGAERQNERGEPEQHGQKAAKHAYPPVLGEHRRRSRVSHVCPFSRLPSNVIALEAAVLKGRESSASH